MKRFSTYCYCSVEQVKINRCSIYILEGKSNTWRGIQNLPKLLPYCVRDRTSPIRGSELILLLYSFHADGYHRYIIPLSPDGKTANKFRKRKCAMGERDSKCQRLYIVQPRLRGFKEMYQIRLS